MPARDRFYAIRRPRCFSIFILYRTDCRSPSFINDATPREPKVIHGSAANNTIHTVYTALDSFELQAPVYLFYLFNMSMQVT